MIENENDKVMRSDMARVCKNLKNSETRPDPNFRVSLGHGTRNLKFFKVKPDPTPTRQFGFGFFLGFLGFLGHSNFLLEDFVL